MDADSRNHVLDGVQDQTNPFTATRGDKSAMLPFAKLLCILLSSEILMVLYAVDILQFAKAL